MVKLEDSVTLVRRRARTPTGRARAVAGQRAAAAEKPAEVAVKEAASAVTTAVAAAVAPALVSTPVQAPAPKASRYATDAEGSSPKRESPQLAAAQKTAPAAVPAVQASAAAADTCHFEFGGAWGGAFLTLALPLIVAYAIECSRNGWQLFCPTTEWIRKLPSRVSSISCSELTNPFLAVLAWYAVQAVLYALPCGALVEGAPLKDGTRLRYRCNGFFAFVVTLVAFFADYVYSGTSHVGQFVKGNIHWLALASFVYSALLGVLLYVKARWAPASQLAPAASGNIANDFFMGRELNPRLGSFDLKFFFELRPGLIGWALINLSLVWPSGSLAARLVASCQILYVADALWNEPAILTTFDILQEGFGFMLAFGDLVWVPFLYTLQTQYLAADGSHGVQEIWILAGIATLNVLGYYIFRTSNNEKNEFRRNPYNPNLAHLESIATPLGKRLLVGGWWGVCRRPNYLGDLTMALAWALPCGFRHVLPYLHLISFAALLVHRLQRDEALCKQRYGASAWHEFCQRVRYRIIPYVY